jgi:hypothetical protein
MHGDHTRRLHNATKGTGLTAFGTKCANWRLGFPSVICWRLIGVVDTHANDRHRWAPVACWHHQSRPRYHLLFRALALSAIGVRMAEGAVTSKCVLSTATRTRASVFSLIVTGIFGCFDAVLAAASLGQPPEFWPYLADGPP